MTPEQQLNTILISLGVWSTLTTIIILLARRDTKLGLKKWFMLKFRKQPLKIRYHGPNKSVDEMIIGMKGKGETFTLFDKKLLFIKTDSGMRFIIDESSIRRCDDGVNELTYSYKSIMPIDPTMSKEEVAAELGEFVKRIKSEKPEQQEPGKLQPLNEEELVRYTDPKRLNKLIDYIYLAAKADALAAATDVEKYVKWTLIGVGLSILGIVALYYMLDSKAIPMLQAIRGTVKTIAQNVAGVLKL